ncbi:MAG: hypothetical protein ACUVT0_05385 [Thermochromatium sp.]
MTDGVLLFESFKLMLIGMGIVFGFLLLVGSLRLEIAAYFRRERTLRLVDPVVDDVLIYAIFPQVGLRFIENRDNPAAFEPRPREIELVLVGG